MTSFWYSEQAEPMSARSLVIVFLATPVIRTVARMLTPSTRHPTTWTRLAVVSLFIMTIMLDRSLKSQENGSDFFSSFVVP